MNNFLEVMKDEMTITQLRIDAGGRNDKVLQSNLNILKRSEKIYQDYSPEYMQRKLPDSYKDFPMM